MVISAMPVLFISDWVKSTVSNIIKETRSGLWNSLSASYLKAPTSENEWKQIKYEMFTQWDFPNCIGAKDG